MELVEERTGGQRRGGKEKIYRAVSRSMFDESTWPMLRVQAALRMIKSGEEPIPVTVGMACFESPKDAEVAPFELPGS